MTKIIAICGPKGSGKTTLASQLENNHNYFRLSFAQPIKTMLRALMKFQGASQEDINHFMYESGKESPCSYFANRSFRHAAETLGTEWRQLIDDDLWINIVHQRLSKGPDKIVVDDLRFLNEARMLRSINATIVRIERDGHGPGTHPAEREYLLISEPITIVNDGDPIDMLNELQHQVSL